MKIIDIDEVAVGPYSGNEISSIFANCQVGIISVSQKNSPIYELIDVRARSIVLDAMEYIEDRITQIILYDCVIDIDTTTKDHIFDIAEIMLLNVYIRNDIGTVRMVFEIIRPEPELGNINLLIEK